MSEFWYSSNTSTNLQQAWVIYPSNFDSSESYPLALLSHGGPEDSNFNIWGGYSGYFNFKLWADQGYVVVAPNPTGSWGFGQNLTDTVYGHYGDYAYWDLVHCFNNIEEHLPFVDAGNAIHAGQSFGGFMSNWYV